MNPSPLDISLARLQDLPFFNRSIGIDNDLFFADLVLDEKLQHDMQYPCRFEGFFAVFCLEGKMKAEIDLTSYDVSRGTLILNVPGSIFRCYAEDPSRPLRFFCFWMSHEFATSAIRSDFVHLFDESATMMEYPCIRLSKEETGIAVRYMRLAADVMRMDLDTKRQSVGGLISSFFQLMGAVWLRNRDESKRVPDHSATRSRQIFNRFLKLVADHHTRERNVKFYADALCLTPKYLSKLIKQTSGKSAPQWIDSFIILEAKNMLRYSDDPIKQIVYSLNFPNQSVFYKFFKMHTGMTPREYRRS